MRKRASWLLVQLQRLGLWAFYRATVDRAAGWDRPSPQGRKIALTRIDGIGDFLVWLNTAAAIRERFPAPDHRIVLIAERSFASLAERLPYFDEVWPVDYRKFVLKPAYRYCVLRRVRRGGFSMAINPMHTRIGIAGRGGPLGGDALVRASGADDRIGSTGGKARRGLLNRIVSDKIYTKLIPVSPGTESEFVRNADFLNGLGLDILDSSLPHLPVSDDDFPDEWNAGGREYLVLIPGALADHRRWPVANFAEIAQRVHERTGWVAIVCGGPSEAHLGQALEASAPATIRNLVGKTSLPGLAALIAGARLVVANETGATHLAAVVRTPVVCILGGGHHGRFVPYPDRFRDRISTPLPVIYPLDCFGCDWNCIYPVARGMPTPCIEKITVDAVWGAIEPLIESMAQDTLGS